MIHIVNWLLTRRCNLRCSYCGIVRDYENKPIKYPNMKYYHENEMDTDYIINGLEKIKKHNKDAFHIFYGGEPFLKEGLLEIIKYCNEEDIEYTIISNNSPLVQDKIDFILSETRIKGLTCSIDPLIFLDDDNDMVRKSHYGFDNFIKLREHISDLVVEMTISNDNVQYIYDTLKTLYNCELTTIINFVDISKNDYYDFSNVKDKSSLVYNNEYLKKQFDNLYDDNLLNIHMNYTFLNKVLEILPSNLNCKIEDNLHNITIDSDGSIRLCLRIRGVSTPYNFKIDNLIIDNGDVNEHVYDCIKLDKNNYCELCNWTCMIMSDYISKTNQLNDLIHDKDRKNDK